MRLPLPLNVTPEIVIGADITIDDLIEASMQSSTIKIDKQFRLRLATNDEDFRARLSHSSRPDEWLSAHDDLIGSPSEILAFSPLNTYPHDSLAPRTLVRTLMFSMIALHASRMDGRGQDVIDLLISFLNVGLYPEIVFLSSADDPKLALRSIAWCLAGDSRLEVHGTLTDTRTALFNAGLESISPHSLASSGIFQDDALVLASLALSIEAVEMSGAVQRKLLAVSAKIFQTLDNVTEGIGDGAPLSRDTDAADEAPMRSRNVDSLVKQLRASVADEFGLYDPSEKMAISVETLEDILIAISAAVCEAASETATDAASLINSYRQIAKSRGATPFSIRRMEDMIAIYNVGINGLSNAAHHWDSDRFISRQRKTMKRFFIAKEFERILEYWRRLLSIQAILLAECAEFAPEQKDEFVGDFIDRVDAVAPGEGRLVRPPDSEVIYLSKMLVGLLNSSEMSNSGTLA